MSSISKRQILQLVEKFLVTEEAYHKAVRSSSCYPATLAERQRLRNELDNLIETELHANGRDKL